MFYYFIQQHEKEDVKPENVIPDEPENVVQDESEDVEPDKPDEVATEEPELIIEIFYRDESQPEFLVFLLKLMHKSRNSTRPLKLRREAAEQ